jgi:hypothetical protein
MQDVVVAVEADSSAELSTALETLQSVRAGAVLVVVDAGAPLERTRHWLDALGQVDALAVTGAGSVPEPAAVLQLGLPVVRLDGIPLDRATWAALLCAQLTAASAVLDGVLPVAGTGA